MGAVLGDRSPPPRRADPLHRAHRGPEPPLAGGCLLRAGGDRDGAGGPHLHGHVERGAHAPAPAAPSLHRRPDLRRARRARPRGATPHRATGARRPRPHLADRCPDTREGTRRRRDRVPSRHAHLRRQRAPAHDGGPAHVLDRRHRVGVPGGTRAVADGPRLSTGRRDPDEERARSDAADGARRRPRQRGAALDPPPPVGVDRRPARPGPRGLVALPPVVDPGVGAR